jgi:hypothetical protein
MGRLGGYMSEGKLWQDYSSHSFGLLYHVHGNWLYKHVRVATVARLQDAALQSGALFSGG